MKAEEQQRRAAVRARLEARREARRGALAGAWDAAASPTVAGALRDAIAAVLPDDTPRRDTVIDLTARHAGYVLGANPIVNLTSITEPRQIAVKHVLDSVLPWPIFASSSSLLEIGSGGGYPGIPLAVVFPDKLFILAESTGKKAEFLAGVVDALELRNVAVLGERAENVLREESVDTVFGRAIGSASKIIRFIGPVAERFERLVLYKGPSAANEIDDARDASERAGLEGEVTLSYELPEGLGSRSILEYRPTPA